MKLYRFLKAAFHDNRMVQPGEEVLCSDDIIPGAHMAPTPLQQVVDLDAIGSPRTPRHAAWLLPDPGQMRRAADAVRNAVEQLRQVLAGEEWKQPQFNRQHAVT